MSWHAFQVRENTIWAAAKAPTKEAALQIVKGGAKNTDKIYAFNNEYFDEKIFLKDILLQQKNNVPSDQKATRQKGKILVVGSALLDITLHVKELPLKGDNIFTDNIKIAPGGCAYNVACTLRNMKRNFELWVPTGYGVCAVKLRETLKDKPWIKNINTEQRDNGFCVELVTPDAERTMITVGGVEQKFKPEWLDKINTSEYDSVYVSGYEMVSGGECFVEWLAAWKELAPDLEIFFAPGPVITKISPVIMGRMFSLKPVLHMNKSEALNFTQRTKPEYAGRNLFEITKKPVIITDGGNGAGIYYNSYVHLDGVPVNAIDSTGAGDSHIAAVMGARQEGCSWIQAVARANEVASRIVTVRGANRFANEE